MGSGVAPLAVGDGNPEYILQYILSLHQGLGNYRCESIKHFPPHTCPSSAPNTSAHSGYLKAELNTGMVPEVALIVVVTREDIPKRVNK